MTNDEEIRRADNVQRLLDDPLMAEAFDGIESGIFDAMRKCAISDTSTQHELVLMLQLMGRLRGHFKTIMETGKLALIQKETLAERVVRRLRA